MERQLAYSDKPPRRCSSKLRLVKATFEMNRSGSYQNLVYMVWCNSLSIALPVLAPPCITCSLVLQAFGDKVFLIFKTGFYLLIVSRM